MEENYFPRGSSHPPATTSDKESLKKTKKRKPDGAEKPEKESPSYLFGSQSPRKKTKKEIKNAKERERKQRKVQEAKKPAQKVENEDLDVSERNLEKRMKEQNLEEAEESFHGSTTPLEPLRLKNLTEDLLLLGVVKDIGELELTISLPSGIIGYVTVTNISNTFTKLLEKVSEEETEDDNALDDVALTSLYRVGDLVPCRVLSSESKSGSYTKVSLSLNPSDVNRDLNTAMLRKNLVLSGVVKSIEDHGYVIDTGIQGANIFLSQEEAAEYLRICEQKQLRIAQPVKCLVTEVKANGRFANVTLDPTTLSEAKSVVANSIAELLPGIRVTAQVRKVTNSLIEVSFAKAYQGSVDFFYLAKIDDAMKKYSVQSKHEAVIVFQDPESKRFGLSFKDVHFGRNILDSLPGCSSKGPRVGSKFRLSRVIGMYSKRGILCDLKNGYYGCAVPSEYPEDGKQLAIGSFAPCRVLNFNFFDMLALVSFKESVYKAPFLGYSDLIPGQLLKGKVNKIAARGIVVELPQKVTGFVPQVHLSDIPIKNISAMFQEGSDIQVRVLHVDPDRRKLCLTHKKTLVESELPIIKSFEHFQDGQTLHGVISSVADYGCIVTFYNKVSGLLHKSQLSNIPDLDPKENFYVGQVIKCHVSRTFDPKLRKVHLSLLSIPENQLWPQKISSKKPDEDQLFLEGNEESDGDENESELLLLKAKVEKATVTSVSKEGVEVVMETDNQEAFIPKMHLCDLPSQVELAMKSFKKGDTFKAVPWSRTGNGLMATCKPMILRAVLAESNRNFQSPFELKKDAVTVGVVGKVMSNGIVVNFPNKRHGFCRSTLMSDGEVLEVKPVQPGQTVVVKVLDNRLKLSMRASHIRFKSQAKHIRDLFMDHFQLEERLRNLSSNKDSPLISTKVGTVVSGHVTKIQEGRILVTTKEDLTAVVSDVSLGDSDLEVGDEVTGCVLHVDLTHKQIVISLEEDVVSASQKKLRKIKRDKHRSKTLVEMGRVLYSTDLYHLVYYQNMLVYLPARKQINDYPEPLVIGENVVLGQNVTFGRMYGRVFVKLPACKGKDKLEGISHDSVWSKESNQNLSKDEIRDKIDRKIDILSGSMGISVGQTIEVVVKIVYKEFILVRTKSDILGRIHLTEAKDAIEQGKSPLEDFNGGRTITARVIGFLALKDGELMPINDPNFTKLSLELTVKPSKLEKTFPMEVPSFEKELNSYKKGQKVVGYPIKYVDGYVFMSVSPAVQGVAHVLDLSDEISILEKPEDSFPHFCAVNLKVVSVDKDTQQLILQQSRQNKNRVSKGETVMGKIVDIIEHSMFFQLPQGHVGTAFATDVRDHFAPKPLKGFKVGQFCKCYILDMEPDNHVSLSVRPSRVEQKKVKDMDNDIQKIDDLRVGQEVKGYIMDVKDDKIMVGVSRSIQGTMNTSALTSILKKQLTPGNPISVIISKIRGNRVTFVSVEEKGRVDQSDDEMSSDEESMEESKPVKVKRKDVESEEEDEDEEGDKEQRKLEESESDSESEEDEPTPTVSVDEKKGRKGKQGRDKKARLQINVKDAWDEEARDVVESKDDSDSESEEEEKEVKQVAKKQTKQERLAKAKAEEDFLFKTEHALMDTDRAPETIDDFDRMVTTSPNSSIVWIRYMAFHLDAGDVEKARAVAEKALKMINFREEQEKLNVWVALMNLENTNGSEDMLLKVFERALSNCEPYRVFEHLINIYTRSGKIESADAVYNTMLKRFRLEKSVWVQYGTFLMHHGKQDSAKNLLQRSFKSLAKKDHIDVISKFAQLEYKVGEPEQGQTMFENVLSNYPKRTDIWSIYLDMVIKTGDMKNVRHLFERVITLNLSPKKIKFFFNRFLEFEKKHGTDAEVDAVKQKAIEYVESKSGMDFNET
ncbi:protein RRP5 homolog isoform X2 [Apostichopus japonicus]